LEISITNNIGKTNSENIDITVDSEELINPKYSIVEFTSKNKLKPELTVKFSLNGEDEDVDDFNFVYFESKNLIFYRFLYQWGIIDWKLKKLKRSIFSGIIDFPFFYLHKNCFLIVDDLFAETVDFNGNKIDHIPNEQPHEIKEHENYFEFDIIGVEKRMLRKITTGNNVYN
jgi:hypothetical protein